MSAPLEPYERYAPPGQPDVRHGEIELYNERPAVMWVPSAENPSVMVPVLKQYVQPMPLPPARDLTPQPLLDPLTQRMIGGGVGIGAAGAGLGWGAGQMFAGMALMGGSGLMLLLGLLLAAGMRGRRAGVRVEVYQHARFGKNEVKL